MGVQTIFSPQPLSGSVSLHTCLFPLEKQKGKVPTSGTESPFCPYLGSGSGQKGRLRFPGRMIRVPGSLEDTESSQTSFAERRQTPLLLPPLVGSEPAGASQWVVLGAVLPALSARWGETPKPQHSWPSGLVLHPCRIRCPCPLSQHAPGTGRAVGTHRAASAAVPVPPAPRCLCSPTAASPEFTHIHVKAFLFVWGLEIHSAGAAASGKFASPSWL